MKELQTVESHLIEIECVVLCCNREINFTSLIKDPMMEVMVKVEDAQEDDESAFLSLSCGYSDAKRTSLEDIVKVEDAREDKESAFLSMSCGYSDLKRTSLEVIVKEEDVSEDEDTTLPSYSGSSKQVAMVKAEDAQEHERLGCPPQVADRGEISSRAGSTLELNNSLSGCRETEQKRNQATVLGMDCRAGERLLPVLWDQREVCINKAQPRKPNLMEKLREKSKQKAKNSPDEEENNVHLSPPFGNKNATKHTRLIEFGWMHNRKQVRSRNGGGTRKLIVPKNAGYDDLFRLGKELFFPSGSSTKGPERDFIFNIRDYGGSEMPRSASVGALYEPLKHGMLRLYLCSIDRGESEPESEFRCESESESCSSETVSSPAKPLGQASCYGEPCSSLDFSSNNFAHEVLNYSQESYHFAVEASPSFKPRQHAPLNSNSSDSPREHLNGFQESYHSVFEAPPLYNLGTATPPPTPKRARWDPGQRAAQKTLRLRRVNITHEMIEQFQDPDIVDASVSVSFVEESGIDTSGPAQEGYSGFWEAFLQADVSDGAERVPVLQPDYGKAEWEAVGRILLKGYQDHGYFPTQLAPPFTVCLIHGEEKVTPEMLMKSFLRFATPAERNILSSALEGGQYEMADLLDILHRMRVHSLPEGGTIEDIIVRMAHTQLIQEPMYALLWMANTAQGGLRLLLPTVSAVTALYET